MKKATIALMLICLVGVLTSCGGSTADVNLSSIEKRLAALESENDRISQKLNDLEKQIVKPVNPTPNETKTPGIPIQASTEQPISKAGFYKDERSSSLDYTCYRFGDQLSGCEIQIPADWIIIEEGDTLKIEYKRDWIDLVYTYQIDPTIANPVECEKKIRTTIDSYQCDGFDEVVFGDAIRGSVGEFILPSIDSLNIKHGININYDETWWLFTTQNNTGVCCYHEKSSYEKLNESRYLVDYSLLEYVGYFYYEKVGALHVTTEVNLLDYQGAYHSLSTSIEKNTMEVEWSHFVTSTNYPIIRNKGASYNPYESGAFGSFVNATSIVH